MSMEFAFAAVPFGKDGAISDLHTKDVPTGGDFTKHLRKGVVWIGVKEEHRVPLPIGLALTIWSKQEVNEHSDWALSRLLDDCGGSQSYILLAPRRQYVEQLKRSVERMPRLALRKFVEVFVENAEYALRTYGDKAALVIF